jgi:hypothetical protein
MGISVISLLMLPSSQSNPIAQQILESAGANPTLIAALSLVTIAINFLSGVLLLRGRDVGRKLYLFATPILTMLVIAAYNFQQLTIQLFGLLFYAIIWYFLSREHVRHYLSGVQTLSEDVAHIPSLNGAPRQDNAKNFGSGFLLVIAGFFLLPWYIMVGMFFDNLIALLFVSVLMLLPASIFATIAIWLQGWTRSVFLVGLLLACSGGLSIMIGAMFLTMFSDPAMVALVPNSDPEKLAQMGNGSIVTGALGLLAGILCALYQRTVDKERLASVQRPN